MSNITMKAIVDQLSALTLLEAADLTKMLEEAWGVSAAAPVAVAASGPSAAAEAVEEKTEFDVILVAAGDKKIEVIKEVRAVTGLGLKEAKDMAESANVILKTGISKADAESIKEKLEKVGATIKLS